MKVVISLVGGSLDDCILSGDSEKPTPACENALIFYRETENGSVGHRFKVPKFHEQETYEVIRRSENDNCVIVRTRLVVG